MNHTPQIKKAIQFAARKHHGQMRLEVEPLPYITHLFSVALLVAEDLPAQAGGSSDDVVTAALLHDTIEDTDTTKGEIAQEFNEHVAELVTSVSEIKTKFGIPVTWKKRKTSYLANLETSSDEAVLIATADKIDNIESVLEAYGRGGKGLEKRSRPPKEEYFWYHSEVLRIAEARLPEHPLTKRLREAYERERGMLSRS